MSVKHSFAAWPERSPSGEDAAARAVFRRFVGRLIGLARRQLGRRLAHAVAADDVVQSAYRSCCVRRRRAGELQVGACDDLWGLLTRITLRRCADRGRLPPGGAVPARSPVRTTPEGGESLPRPA